MTTKADRTKELIIEKAAPIFNKKGYAGTSMNDIMRATGLAKGGLYGNFKSKDEIAALAFEYSYNRMREDLASKVGPKKTALEKLLAILQYYRHYITAPPIEGGCPLLNTAIDADDAYPFLKKKAKHALQEMLGSLQRIIQKGIDEKAFQAKVDTRKEAELIFAQIEGGIMMAQISDDESILHRLLDHLEHHINTTYLK